jgi:hypothetical protein
MRFHFEEHANPVPALFRLLDPPPFVQIGASYKILPSHRCLIG